MTNEEMLKELEEKVSKFIAIHEGVLETYRKNADSIPEELFVVVLETYEMAIIQGGQNARQLQGALEAIKRRDILRAATDDGEKA